MSLYLQELSAKDTMILREAARRLAPVIRTTVYNAELSLRATLDHVTPPQTEPAQPKPQRPPKPGLAYISVSQRNRRDVRATAKINKIETRNQIKAERQAVKSAARKARRLSA